jgi:tetraacyldisaccharide 4'-kinase
VPILFPYRVVQLVSLPFVILYFATRLLSRRAYWSHFGERLGFLPRSFKRTAPGSIWLHAVSAGEIATVVPLIQQIRAGDPRVAIFVSTTTLAGRSAADKRLRELADGVFFCPLDYPSCIRRALNAIKPSMVMILETEIWPSLYAESKRFGACLILVNARISSKSWPQYAAMKWFFAPVLRLADAVFPQSIADRDRYYQLGVAPAKLHTAGNLKYDASSTVPAAFLPAFDARQIWIAASTVGPGDSRHYKHDVDEDDIVLDAFQKLSEGFPELLLILAPRQPARFEAVARKLRDRGISFVRRTAIQNQFHPSLRLPGVLLLDTIGELSGAFSMADVVFVGGSIAPRGGHNILEPAACGVPIVTGKHMENFEAIARDFAGGGALVQVESRDDLAPAISQLLHDTATAETMGRRAQQIIGQQQGAAERVMERVWPMYWAASMKVSPGILARLVLAPLAGLWEAGSLLKRRRDLARQQHLPVPVISIGGITVGGAGKTPFTNYLTRCLRLRGYHPAVLTRGYRRATPAKNIIIPAGAGVSPALTGDEAQIFLRAGICPIGIGANRAETGRLLLEHFPADIFVLDDGFQHARLHRDIDIVMIDGLMPFGRGFLVPLGRLREPVEALGRADVLIVSRADHDPRFEHLRKELRRFNQVAPIFRVRTRPRQWRLYSKRQVVDDLPAKKVGAFCALGNPQAFWNTLDGIGLNVVFHWSFPDHHVYQQLELRRIASQALRAGAEMLVTTEKDRINFPRDFASSLAPLDVAWLEIENTVDDEEELLSWIESALSARFAKIRY